MNHRIVVAVRAALPSPRPQGWQALQQAVGLADAGAQVVLIGDAPRPDGGPADLAEWLGRALPSALTVRTPARPSRPPLAGVRFRFALGRAHGGTLLCRDPRVAAAQAGRWPRVVMEWHVRPDPEQSTHRDALRGADLHVTPAPGLHEDLLAMGAPASRAILIPNACGLDPLRARRRAERRDPAGPVLAMGLHRRDGMDDVIAAWAAHRDLPDLWIAGRDQGGARVARWTDRLDAAGLSGRVRLLGPVWGAARDHLLDGCAAWLAPYPDDASTRSRLCPLQVADALGSGLPVIAPRLRSITALGGDPTVYAAGDIDALAAAVRRGVQRSMPAPHLRPRWIDRGRALLLAIHRLPARAA